MEEKIHAVSEQKYVDILSNGGFKAFFGDESNKEAVMELLNTLLPKHRQIKDIDYRPTEHQGPVSNHDSFQSKNQNPPSPKKRRRVHSFILEHQLFWNSS